MWRTIFLHDFPDASIRNFHAAPGHAAAASLSLAPAWDAQEQRYGIPFELNKGFEYTLNEAVPDAIGVSLRARVRFRSGVGPQKYPLFHLGDALTVGLWGGEMDATKGVASIAFQLGDGAAHILGKVSITTTRPILYRVDWHASGQLKVYFDGALVAYHNAVHPGVQFAFDRVGFGMVPYAMPAGQGYTITAVSVKCLQRETILRKLVRPMPGIAMPPGLSVRCRSAAMGRLLANVATLRAFMAQFHATASQPWVQREGHTDSPFTPAALQAHAMAVKAAAALGEMMRTWDFSHQQRFLDPLGKFLRITHTALPQAFAELASKITSTKGVSDACTVPEEKVDPGTRRQYAGLVELMEKTQELILTIAQIH